MAARRARRVAAVRARRGVGSCSTRTVFGVHTLAIGCNEATARLCGMRVERVKLAHLRAVGPVRGPGRRHAVRAAHRRRSDHGARQGARRDRRGRDRRRQPVRRQRQHPRLADRRVPDDACSPTAARCWACRTTCRRSWSARSSSRPSRSIGCGTGAARDAAPALRHSRATISQAAVTSNV